MPPLHPITFIPMPISSINETMHRLMVEKVSKSNPTGFRPIADNAFR